MKDKIIETKINHIKYCPKCGKPVLGKHNIKIKENYLECCKCGLRFRIILNNELEIPFENIMEKEGVNDWIEKINKRMNDCIESETLELVKILCKHLKDIVREKELERVYQEIEKHNLCDGFDGNDLCTTTLKKQIAKDLGDIWVNKGGMQ